MIGIKDNINAFLLAIYIWSFTVFRIIWSFNSEYSTIILAIFAILIISISFFSTKNRINNSLLMSFAVISFFLIILLLDIVFRNNSILGIRIYEFIIYAAIPIILFSQIKDFKLFLKVYVHISVFVFFMYASDPFNEYFFSGDYMTFGFQVMLPVFFGLHIGRIEFNYQKLQIFEVISFFLIFIFGNRMATISCIVFLISMDIMYCGFTYKKMIKYFSIMIFSVWITFILPNILEIIVNFLNSKGYTSYALNSIVFYLNGTSDSLSSGRDYLWHNAIAMIKDRPILGYGVGFYESVYNIYVHNFIFEILLSYGIIGLVVFCMLLLNSFVKILKSQKYFQLMGILMLSTSFPKLFTSIYIFKEPSFWIFIFYGFFISIYHHNNIRKRILNHKKDLIRKGYSV